MKYLLNKIQLDIIKKSNNKIITQVKTKMLTIQPQQQQYRNDTTKSQHKSTSLSKQEKKIKRVKNHQAVLNLMQMQQHIQIMKRRHKYLQVKDDQNRSKTIQHQKKLNSYQYRREEMKRDRLQKQRIMKIKQQQAEAVKEKNKEFKDQKQKRIASSLDKFHIDRVQQYQSVKQEQQLNETNIQKFKQNYLKQKQQLRKQVAQKQEVSKLNISRYKQVKVKEATENRSSEYDKIIAIAAKRQKQLNKLSKMEQQMVQKNSQSLQVSQNIKNKLREVLGAQRRYTKLPSIGKNNNSSTSQTRSSTGHTQTQQHVLLL